MSQKRALRDYEELLDFARQELREDQQKLIRMRAHEADPAEITALEEEIELLKKGVDRYQIRIKTLKNALQESQDYE